MPRNGGIASYQNLDATQWRQCTRSLNNQSNDHASRNLAVFAMYHSPLLGTVVLYKACPPRLMVCVLNCAFKHTPTLLRAFAPRLAVLPTRALPYLDIMSTNPSQRQSRPGTTLPPIGALIDVADRGMYHNERQQRYPPTPPGAAGGHGYHQTSEGGAYPVPVHPIPMGTNAAPSGATSSRRHVCTQCGQAFDRPSSLQTHMHTHTGEQPYECPHPGCGRRFSVKSNMRRHYSVHEQPRMTDADGDEAYDHRHGGEYGVFSVAQR